MGDIYYDVSERNAIRSIFFSILLRIVLKRQIYPCTNSLMKTHIHVAGLASYSRAEYDPIIGKVM